MECLAVKTYRHLLNILSSPAAVAVEIILFLAVVVLAVCSVELQQLQVELIQSL
jgi:hypothetical protein